MLIFWLKTTHTHAHTHTAAAAHNSLVLRSVYVIYLLLFFNFSLTQFSFILSPRTGYFEKFYFGIFLQSVGIFFN